jgi:hypothetical protein
MHHNHSLTSADRSRRESLTSFFERHSSDDRFATVIEKVLSFTRRRLGAHVDICDISVCHFNAFSSF